MNKKQIYLPEVCISGSLENVTAKHFFTVDQLQRDVDYYRAQKIAKSMFDSGLIFFVTI